MTVHPSAEDGGWTVVVVELCIPDIPVTSQSERKRRTKECCFFFPSADRGQGSEVAESEGVPVEPRGPSSHHDVAAAVQGQVVGAGEGAVALGAAEGLDPRVLAEVSGQLVGAGKAPGAALPGAVIRLLTCRGHSRKAGVSLGPRRLTALKLFTVISGLQVLNLVGNQPPVAAG